MDNRRAERPRQRSVASLAVVCALVIASVASVAAGVWLPIPFDDANGATSVAALYFGFQITAQSVLFATAFVGTGRWPSLFQVSRNTLFVEWLCVGGLATLGSALGVLFHVKVLADAASYLWLVADAFGTWSFIRLFSLASVEGRNALLTRTLRDGLASASLTSALTPAGHLEDAALAAHTAAFETAIANGAAGEVNELVRQVLSLKDDRSCYPALITYQFSLTSTLARAALFGKLDARHASSAMSLLSQPANFSGYAIGDGGDGVSWPVAWSALVTRYYAWLRQAALQLAVAEHVTSLAVRPVLRVGDEVRATHLRWVDPAPINPVSAAEQTTPLAGPIEVLFWYREFVSFLGPHCAPSSYVLYQALSGHRYTHNYADGAMILEQLSVAIFGTEIPATEEAIRARTVIGDRANFESILTQICAHQLMALPGSVEGSMSAPPGLTYSAPDYREFAASLAIIGSIGNLRTSGEARKLLVREIVCPTDPWKHTARSVQSFLDQVTRISRSEGHERLGALVIVAALRLARSLDDPAHPEVSKFLSELPVEVSQMARRLASRLLSYGPHRDACTSSSNPIEMLLAKPFELLAKARIENGGAK